MKREELKLLTALLWNFRVQYYDELNKSESRSIMEVLALLVMKVEK